jgi:glucokinase
MVMITVGTGIGGGIVLERQALARAPTASPASSATSSPVPDGHPCGCGRLGCLEQYASGNALVRFARAGARQEPERASQLLELAGGDRLAISGRQITEAGAGTATAWPATRSPDRLLARRRDGRPRAELDPQILVVGGGVVDAG